METFSALLAICAGNSPVPGEFPAQRPVTRSFDVFFDLCLNKRLSKPWWDWWFETLSLPLWRHRNDCVDTGRNPLIPLGTRYNTWLWTSGLVNGLASCWHQAIKQINDDKDYQSIVILLQTFPIFHLHLHCHFELQGDELREIQTKKYRMTFPTGKPPFVLVTSLWSICSVTLEIWSQVYCISVLFSFNICKQTLRVMMMTTMITIKTTITLTLFGNIRGSTELKLALIYGSGHETVAVLLPGFAINW